STSDSPGSRWPAGWLKSRPRAVSSSISRKRPSRSTTAATVTLGFQTMGAYCRAPVKTSDRRRDAGECDGSAPSFPSWICPKKRQGRNPAFFVQRSEEDYFFSSFFSSFFGSPFGSPFLPSDFFVS